MVDGDPGETSNSVISTDATPDFARQFPCVCCGYLTLSEGAGEHEICMICWWQDDPSQLRWPAMSGGANEPSLIEGQKNYREFGASTPARKGRARSPRAFEKRDLNWYAIDPSDLRFEAVGVHGGPWPTDRQVLYWWRTNYWRGINDGE